MRILKIRFKNLNSLRGEWEIDLTDSAFGKDGIFAITGPTGSGKSTILDAICLALYGRTPRLYRINKGSNEMMSRRTGECFSEVSFETQSGRYICFWSQARARKKPDGELQTPKQEISDLDTHEIFETSVKGFSEKVISVTGMDFDRFTRSMLLAQGGFAAFLQSSADDRAPILEDITGTEIYTKISIQVHEQFIHVRKKTEELKNELDRLQLLSDEDIYLLNQDLSELHKEDERMQQDLDQLIMSIGWIDNILKIEKEAAETGQKKKELLQQMNDFEPERIKLSFAESALELSGDYSLLTALRKEADADRKTLISCEDNMPELLRQMSIAEQTFRQSEMKLTDAKEKQNESFPLIRKVRDLDRKWDENDRDLQEMIKQLEQMEENCKEQRNYVESKKITKNEIVDRNNELITILDISQNDESLVENLAMIKERINTLQSVHHRYTQKEDDRKRAEEDLVKKESLVQQLSEKIILLQNHLHETAEKLNRKIVEHRDIMQDRSFVSWNEQLSREKENLHFIHEGLELISNWSDTEGEVQAYHKLITDSMTANDNISMNLQDAMKERGVIEKQEHLLAVQVQLLQKISDLDYMRCQLIDGELCPLCGSLDHPFAMGNIPILADSEKEYMAMKAKLNELIQMIHEKQTQQTGIAKDILHWETEVTKLQDRQKAIVRRIFDIVNVHLVDKNVLNIDTPNLIFDDLQAEKTDMDSISQMNAILAEYQEKCKIMITECQDVISGSILIDTEIKAYRDHMEIQKENEATTQYEFQTAQHNCSVAKNLVLRYKLELDGEQAQQTELLSKVLKDISPYFVFQHPVHVEFISCVQNYQSNHPIFDRFQEIIELLSEKRNQWMKNTEEKAELESSLSSVTLQMDNAIRTVEQLNNDIEKISEMETQLKKVQEVVKSERQMIFSDKDADDEEKKLMEDIVISGKQLEKEREILQHCKENVMIVDSRMTDLVKSIGKRDDQLDMLEKSFALRLAASTFSSESEWLDSCMPEDQRKELARKANGLTEEKAAIFAKEKHETEQLEKETSRRLSELSYDTLKENHAMTMELQKDLQRKSGVLQQKLLENETIKEQQAEKVETVILQQKEYDRWLLLHELIGSADGKKYRNFAQGLTFELMISYANEQLQKLSDRYLLIRDEYQALDLNVIDLYQAGEVRSTRNLSGGESFIVSLSLALGLSRMASKKVRVDSLFLDEGFGTLDEDALNTALETLSGLRQDGKLIGIISHVPALKERIGTQIQVLPRAGGKSTLVGPGCRKISD